MKTAMQRSEFYVAIVILVLFVVIGSQSSAFFTAGNMIDLIRSGIIMAIFSVCCMMVIISGGIDVSFPAIATFSMFTTTKILHDLQYDGSVILAFVLSGLIGLCLGLINALFIAWFKLPTLIVTLGTSTMFSGFLLSFLGNRDISDIPVGMLEFSKMQIWSVTNENGSTSSLPASVLIMVCIIAVVAILLRYTMIGRGIYAMGGDPESAQRIGFSIPSLQCFLYSFVGLLAGIAGMIHACMMRSANPVDLLGGELLIIAAVVLGGTRITGGYGTVSGSLLGLLLVIVIQNSLILMGIPSYWQKFVIGALILIGTGVAAYQVRRSTMKRKPVIL